MAEYHSDNGYPSYEEALDEYDRALGWVPEEERDGTWEEATTVTCSVCLGTGGCWTDEWLPCNACQGTGLLEATV